MTATPTAARPPLVQLTGIHMSFGALRALRGVDMTLNAGEVTALVGDNGAGKSTLVGILSGINAPTAGTVTVDGVTRRFHGPRDARAAGIETVFQDLALIPTLDVMTNIYICREIRRGGLLGRLGFVNRQRMREQLEQALAAENIAIPARGSPVGSLSGGQRQIVAVTRAVFWGAKLVCLDEPTASLGVRQREMVAGYIRRLRDSGVGVLLITHNIEDALKLSDRVVVLRLGRKVADSPIRRLTHERIVLAMSGVGATETGRLHDG